jgi:membrane protein
MQFAMTLHFDRHRANAFVRFLWQRFFDQGCLQTSGALAFTTLFSLVPLTAAVLGIISAFPVFASWRDQLTNFVFDNFVPAAGKVVQTYLTQFADNASKATAIGVLVLLFSAVSLMTSIEEAYNRIWHVPSSRTAVARVLMYWAALSLGPLLLIAALGVSSYVFALPLIDAADSEFALKARLLSVLPLLLTWVALTSSYVVIPNRIVRVRDALIGGGIAGLLFELAKYGFAVYVSTYASFEQVYGTLAMVPIFLFWIYLSWIIVLLGASITASIAAFDYRPESERLPIGQEFAGLLAVLADFAAAQAQGLGLHSREVCMKHTFLNDDLLQGYLDDLIVAGLIQRNEKGEWMLVSDLRAVTLRSLYAAGDYHFSMPPPHIMLLDQFSPELKALLTRTGAALAINLDVPLAEIFPVALRSTVPSASAQDSLITKDSA